MILTVHVRPEAEANIDDAAVWYEAQRTGLGQDFLDETLSTFDRILQNPHMYSILHRQTCRAIMRRFSFGVFYRIEGDSIVVVAVCMAAAIQSGGRKEHSKTKLAGLLLRRLIYGAWL